VRSELRFRHVSAVQAIVYLGGVLSTPARRSLALQIGIWFLWGFLSNIVAIWLASLVFSGIDYGSFGTLVLAALVYSAVNAVLRPIIVLGALPVVILTFGVALLFIQAFMLWLTGEIVGEFHVSSYWVALGGAVFIWIANAIIDALLKPDFKRRQPRMPVEQ
jgi:putative membrane protein